MRDFDCFIDAIESNDSHAVRRLWKVEYRDERYGKSGGTVLHYAIECKASDEIVKFLVESGCDMKELDMEGHSSIDVARIIGAKGAVRVLVEAGCNLVNYVDIDDLTQFDWNNEFIEDFLWTTKMDDDMEDNSICPWKIVDHQRGETVLDKAEMSPRMMAALRAKRVSKQELERWISSMPTPKDPQFVLAREWLLYCCIRDGYQSGFLTLCCPAIVNGATLCMGPSALETAVEFDCDFFVAHILQQIYRLDPLDKSFKRAAAAAKGKTRINISKLLSDRIMYLSGNEERGYSRLHTAVLDNDPDMVRYILENHIFDPEHGDWTVGSALSLAYSLGYMRCVRCLKEHGVNTVDRLGRSPLHVAIIKKREDCCEYLVDNMRDIDAVDRMGLSVLALAVMMDRPRICERIVGRMERVGQAVQIDPQILDMDPDLRMVRCNDPRQRITSNETIPSLCLKIKGTIYPCLLNKVDEHTMDRTYENNNTLLHLCAVSLLHVECHQLITKSASVTSVNDRGETPLLALINENHNAIVGVGAIGGRGSEFEMNMIKTVDVLIEAGSSVNVETSEGFNLLRVAMEYNSENLLLALIKRRELITAVKKDEWLSWFQMKYFVFIRGILPLIDKSLLSEWITEDIIKSHVAEADLTLIKALYDMAVYDVQTSVVETILYAAARNSNEALFAEMSKHEISSKSSLAGGESLCNSLIREEKTGFCSILLLSRNAAALMEKKGGENKLPLHICIERDNLNIIDQLIRNTESVNEEDDDGHTPLSLLLVKMSETGEGETIERLMPYARTLITRSADIHRVNELGRTVISYCTRIGLQQQIEAYARDRQRQLVPEICPICSDERVSCALQCSCRLCQTCATEGVYCSVCGRQTNNKIRKLM